MKKYLKLTNGYELEIEVRYELGGFNLFTYENNERGYYLHVSPVKNVQLKDCVIQEYKAFSGIKKLILPVARKSSKKEVEAIELSKNSEKELIDYVLAKNNMELA
jgi:hypothetical protein